MMRTTKRVMMEAEVAEEARVVMVAEEETATIPPDHRAVVEIWSILSPSAEEALVVAVVEEETAIIPPDHRAVVEIWSIPISLPKRR